MRSVKVGSLVAGYVGGLHAVVVAHHREHPAVTRSAG